MRKLFLTITILIFSFVGFSAMAEGASLFLFPASESFVVGDIFSVKVEVDTAGVPVNTAEAVIYFPVDKLEVTDIQKEDSIFALWPEEPFFSNSSGQISFTGGLPHPGLTGIDDILTINFRAKEEGSAILVFGEGRVLADDGEGTDLLVFIKEAKYSIQKIGVLPEPTQISSPTHPQSEEWYNNNNPRFQWGMDSGATGMSFVLDRNSDTTPDTNSEGLLQSMAFQNLDDGVWYFHLRLANETGWSSSYHYKIQVDVNPPELFEVTIDNGGDPTDPNPLLYFDTNDRISGISHYKLKIGEDEFLKLMLAQVNPFSLPYQSPGKLPIIVRAVDMAGNNVEADAVLNVEPIESPQITFWPRVHVSGEETFYIEGEAIPEAEIMIFLKKDGKDVKEWRSLSSKEGEWSFSTEELLKSGIYYLSVQAQDERGAKSLLSETRKIEVSLSGFSFGPFIVSSKTIVFILSSLLALVIVMMGFFIYKTGRAKKILKKETREAKESVGRAFNALRKEVEEQVEMIDSKPGFTEAERKVYDDLRDALNISEKYISKEIKDIEKELE